ncbi:MAG TPA: efflux RND transporter periplasmic adaptor subunit [Ktedonobacterales bacterium]
MLEPRETTETSPDTLATSSGSGAPTQTATRRDLNATSARDLDDLLGMDDLSDEPPQTSRPRRWWLVAIGAALVVALLGGFFVVRAQGAKKPTTYQTATISEGNLALPVSGTGPVQAALYNLNFDASGRIATIDVSVGQTVKAGQTLATLDTTALRDALNQAQLQVNTAYYQEQQSINTCNTAKSPPPDCVALAENQFASSLQQLQTTKDNLAGATLKATHAGVVTTINGSVGSTPGSGSSSSSSSSSSSGFIQIADPSSLQILSNINETDIGGVSQGQQATFTVTAYPGKVFHATVTAISQVGSTSSTVVTFPVTLNVDMSRLQGVNLYTGMTASVTLVTQRRVNVTLVPASAVTFAHAAANASAGGFLRRTQVADALTQAQQMITTLEQQNPQVAQDNPSAAWTLERNGSQWVVKPIVIGLSSGSFDEVLAGLNPGEVVITGETNGTITTGSSSSTGTGAGGGVGGGRFGGGGGGIIGGGPGGFVGGGSNGD